VVDVFFNFRTTISDFITGDEVVCGKTIAMSYIKGRFILDLIAAIPFELIQETASTGGNLGHLGILSIFKIIRVLRFTKVISYLNTTDDIKWSLKFFKLVFYLIIYLHWQACGWFYYTNFDKKWFPKSDIPLNSQLFYDKGVTYTYCFSFWLSVKILDGADLVPTNPQQAIVVSILIIFS
jgi:hypothetical protein